MHMEQDRSGPPAARWLQPNPVPFWGSRIFRWNLIACSVLLLGAAVWMLVVEPKLNAEAREEAFKAYAAQKYVPRDPASTEPRPIRYDGMLDKVKDDQDPDQRDEPYRYLAKHLSTMDSAKLAEQARLVDYKLLMERPDELRGQAVRLNLQFWTAPAGPVRLDPPAGGVQTVTRAYLALPGAPKEVYFVDFLEPPPDIEKETPVVVDAVFLRRVRFERSDRPGEFHQAPLFVARTVAKVQDPKVPSQYRFLGVAILLGLGTFAFLSYLIVRSFIAARSGGPQPRRIPG
jgi:hypothetical protein